MKFNNYKLSIVFIVFIAFIGVIYSSTMWFTSDEPDYPKIIIRGEKPEGSHVVLWASYYIGGEQCDKYTFSALDMKAHRGGIQHIKYTDSLVDSQKEYKYKIRYKDYTDEQGCEVILDSIEIKAYNAFDYKSGFAELNLSNIESSSINHESMKNPIAEARNCNSDLLELPNKSWLGDVICDLYIKNKMKEKNMASNYRARFNFSKLKPNQEIVYNIIPGPDYKDGHFNEQTGKFDDE